MNARALAVTLALSSLLTITAARAELLPKRPAPGATILCYHIVESPHDPRMEISRETFRQQMRYLATTGYNVIPLADLYAYLSGKKASLPKNAVVVTVDDGWRSTYTEFYPEMKRLHFPFTVFIYPKIIGQTSHALTWAQIREMSKHGVDMQSHAFSHPFLTHRRHATLALKDYDTWLSAELMNSKKTIEREVGRPVSFIAYPYGDYDKHVAEFVARSGYQAALTCDFGRVQRGCDAMRLKRVVIDKRMDFASFRHYLGSNPMKIEEPTPIPGQLVDVDQAVISAKIPNYKALDPDSVGMAVLSAGPTPYIYDPNEGRISVTVGEQLKESTVYRAIIWGMDAKSGKRVEATWTFRTPAPVLPPSLMPAIDASTIAATASPAPGLALRCEAGDVNCETVRNALAPLPAESTMPSSEEGGASSTKMPATSPKPSKSSTPSGISARMPKK